MLIVTLRIVDVSMFLYTVIEAVIAGILLAACTGKADGVTYGRPDKIGRITNTLQILLCVCISICICSLA